MSGASIDPTAIIASDVSIGNSRVWAFVQVREGVVIGNDCNIGNGSYIDSGVQIGNNVSIQNKSLLYRPLIVEDDVFIGPNCVFANDKVPRSGRIRDLTGVSWRIGKGASIGASSTVAPDVNIGEYAMVGACSLVTKDVPPHGLVYGIPATLRAFVCFCGEKLKAEKLVHDMQHLRCPVCNKEVLIPHKTYTLVHQ